MKKKKIFIVSGCVAAAIIAAVIYIIIGFKCSEGKFTVTKYELCEKSLTQSVCISVITDLHCEQYGEHNCELLAAVSESEPDLIFVVGDLVNQTENDYTVAVELLSGLKDIAPVYCVLGNHEYTLMIDFKENIYNAYMQTGVTMLERSYEDIEINGQLLRIGGIYGKCYPYPSDSLTDRTDESEFLEDFENTDRTTLLLCHFPYTWIERGSLDYWNIDAVFCGHAHGGQVRLPLIGGLYAPDQGWFPGRECGIYYSDDGERAMVLSRGLGGKSPVKRFYNTPELVTVELVPEN